MDLEDTTLRKAMDKTPASIVLVVYTFISVWFVGGVSAFHLYLIGTNQVRWRSLFLYVLQISIKQLYIISIFFEMTIPIWFLLFKLICYSV